jgi:hypothetical protein
MIPMKYARENDCAVLSLGAGDGLDVDAFPLEEREGSLLLQLLLDFIDRRDRGHVRGPVFGLPGVFGGVRQDQESIECLGGHRAGEGIHEAGRRRHAHRLDLGGVEAVGHRRPKAIRRPVHDHDALQAAPSDEHARQDEQRPEEQRAEERHDPEPALPHPLDELPPDDREDLVHLASG